MMYQDQSRETEPGYLEKHLMDGDMYFSTDTIPALDVHDGPEVKSPAYKTFDSTSASATLQR
jgi:hypothetical protein